MLAWQPPRRLDSGEFVEGISLKAKMVKRIPTARNQVRSVGFGPSP
jgi:hypothetical protein